MNLGDGLLFELENGKPRLIFTSQGADKKTNKLQSRPRAVAVLSSRQPCCVEEPRSEEQSWPQAGKRHRDPRRRAGVAGGPPTSSTVKIDPHLLAQGNPPKSLTNHVAEGGVKSVPQMRSSKGPDRPSNSTAVGRTALKNSTVTLTSGKPRIKNSAVTLPNGKTGMKNSTVTLTNGKTGIKNTTLTLTSERPPLRENVVCVTNEQLQQILSNLHTDIQEEETQGNGVQSAQGPLEDRMGGAGENDKCTLDVNSAGPTGSSPEKEERSSGLMSWLTDRETLDSKKAHRRRELDGQVLLKQQKVPDALEMLQEETGSVFSVQSSVREQPAAIRSTFKIGSRASPAEEAQSLERREEQRRQWLEELDKQREEAANRRREEKQQRKQTEDHERWTMHFDSFQRRPLVPALAPGPSTLPSATGQATLTLAPDGGNRGELEVGRGPSSCLSLASDNCSWDCLSRASVDTSNTTKTSYMRSMTALLDPAQIEERERRKLKQQEQQKAIEAQMEEKRLRKEREEARRKEEEREEEKRVEMERKMLELQHQLDRQREKEKEEQLSHQKEGLFQSIQRAQQEALRLKEHQRITDLAKKGHDVSKLVQSMKSNVWKTDQDHEEVGAEERREQEENQDQRTVSPRRDMAVQTDSDRRMAPSLSARVCVQTPDIPAEYQAPAAPHNAKRRTERTGKENICLTEPVGGGEGNPYEPFARTERRKERRKPQWNTQRPSRQFVPASERYPAGLQRNRQESRQRRQAELLAQQEKNCLSRINPTSPSQPEGGISSNPTLSSEPPRAKASPSNKVESGPRGTSLSPAVQTDRGRSPPVPALKHRLQSQQPGSLSRPSSHCSSSLPSHPSIHGGAKETALKKRGLLRRRDHCCRL